MKRLLEDLPLAAALAEAGLHDDARQVLAELESYRRNGREKVLLVSGKPAIPEEALRYAVDLSARMDSDLLMVVEAGSSKELDRLREQARATAGDLRKQPGIACVGARGDILKLSRSVLRMVRGVQFALLYAVEDSALFKSLRIPVYSMK